MRRGGEGNVGVYEPSVIPTFGPPGTQVTISGLQPLHAKDGSYRPPTDEDVVAAWWNIDPWAWEHVLMKDRAPLPFGPGAVVFLGEESVGGKCGYSMSFRVPETIPGSYVVTVISILLDEGSPTGWDSAASFRPMTFRVTSGVSLEGM